MYSNSISGLQRPKITYLLKAGRRIRLAEPGLAPTEFFYGYQQLLAQGCDTSIVEDSDVGMAHPLPLVARIANKFSRLLGGLPVGMALSLLMTRGYQQLNNDDCIVATTNGMGMALATAKALGKVKAPVLLLAMGLLPIKPSRWQIRLFGALTRHIHLACISRSEQAFLQQLFPRQSIHFIPFGVDMDFWQPAQAPLGQHDYVLAIGNDSHRDWATLVAAWAPDLPLLKIVTSLPVSAASSNVEVIRGDWRTCLLDDAQVLQLYQGARFVVIPLRDTIQPAGQSVCLQAMACSRPVILSNVAGLWDRQLMRDGDNVLLVKPGSVAELTHSARRLSSDLELGDRLGIAGRRLVKEQYNTNIMANELVRLVQKGLQP